MGLTTDPNDPALGRGIDEQPTSQNEKYLILSDEERAKGYVRPLRTRYIHKGRSICGKDPGFDRPSYPYVGYACTMEPGHEGPCHVAMQVTAEQMARFKATGYMGGCDTTTTMNELIAATYARDPKFYGATYCVHCRRHLDVKEFVWDDGSGQVVGS